MDLSNWGAIVGVLFVAIYGLLSWLSMSRQEQRAFVEDLVRRAQQTMTDADGATKLAFVLSEAKKRFPWLPVEFIRTLAEAAVQRMRAEDPQVLDLYVDQPETRGVSGGVWGNRQV